ncbi:BlaI/MecI/CopY family transcriptional regulator [Hymenobacter arizonensis]|uniref:Predicted transcriptional regulator n=1 Tax=Hymenobacter arizonensis TaxID=1227077 RepID=A0A1I6BE89_HYMAR|nr:BlaI/MecI/CopY family transcriptional regulator [Hymenobacter arizonensis]SFQ79282.1 Predicted transcriptional regulator [Hymenobacter arizonensis]
MHRLSPPEEHVLACLWHWPEGASVTQLRNTLPAPVPPYTTVASTLQQLVGKGYARVDKRGRSHWFRPRLSAPEYARLWLARLVTAHFAGSYAELVRFCWQQGQVSAPELREVLHHTMPSPVAVTRPTS